VYTGAEMPEVRGSTQMPTVVAACIILHIYQFRKPSDEGRCRCSNQNFFTVLLPDLWFFYVVNVLEIAYVDLVPRFYDQRRIEGSRWTTKVFYQSFGIK
jgi:hypothetical protein